MTQVNKKAKTSPIGCNWVFTWNNYNDKKALRPGLIWPNWSTSVRSVQRQRRPIFRAMCGSKEQTVQCSQGT